ncbi:hypothetical protein [Pseudonocardia sp. TMWB2A]
MGFKAEPFYRMAKRGRVERGIMLDDHLFGGKIDAGRSDAGHFS